MSAGKPLIIGALGGRGTGKSAWVKRQIKAAKPPRLAAWDLMQENGDLGTPTQDLGAAIRAMKRPRFRVVFWPSRDDKTRAAQFDLWCRAVLAAGDVLAYVEELAFVTTASRAPAGWREMCLLGRHDMHRVSIIATSQRPSQIDKEFMGNLDVLHCGRLRHRADAETAADLLGVPAHEVQNLPDLHWIETRPGQAEPARGVLKFASSGNSPGARPAPPKGRSPKAQNLRPDGQPGEDGDTPGGMPSAPDHQHPEAPT